MVPLLPLELWIYILRIATEVPGLLDNDSNPPGRIIGHNAILQIKMAIVSVCQSWRVIGIDFLYEYIVLSAVDKRGMASCERLADIFDLYGDKPIGYRYSTKRIDFHIALLQEENVNALFRLLRCVKDLEVLVALPERNGSQICHEDTLIRLSSLIEERFSHSLWRLAANFSTRHLTFQESHGKLSYAKHLPRLPLRALEVEMDDCVEEDDEPPFALSSISTFGINVSTFAQLVECPSWHFPNLTCLLLRQIIDHEIHLFVPFLRLHGSQITYLEIRVDHGTFLSEVGKILQLTPHIRRLSLGYINFDALDVPSLPSLTNITLESIFPSPALSVRPMGLSCILPLLVYEQTPQLDSITLLEDWDEQCSHIQKMGDAERGFLVWETFYNTCRSRQVAIVDRNGRALPERMTIQGIDNEGVLCD